MSDVIRFKLSGNAFVLTAADRREGELREAMHERTDNETFLLQRLDELRAAQAPKET